MNETIDIVTIIDEYAPVILMWWFVCFAIIIPYLLFTESGHQITLKIAKIMRWN